MEADHEPPLDISEFEWTVAKPDRVAVVFVQTGRHYSYTWRGAEGGLSEPAIEGECDPHPAGVIDCLARAVAHRAARQAFPAMPTGSQAPSSAYRSRAVQLRRFLMRGMADGRNWLPRG